MKKIREQVQYEGNWLSLVETIYENDRGEQVVWESIRRSRPATGVVVVAQLMPSGRFVLIKQYRPAINGYTLGFPAGLGSGDPNHALIELKEETGFTGRIVHVSPLLKSHAGVVNDGAYVVYAHIDEESEDNQNPIQSLEPQEEIEVVLVERGEVQSLIEREQKAGTHIGGNLWYLFILSEVLNEHNP